MQCAAAALACLLAAAPALAATALPVANPGFNPPYQPVQADHGQVTGEIAHGWYHNSGYGDVTAVYARGTNAHDPGPCQQITVSAVRSGDLQMLQSVTLHGGTIATVGLWMRGAPGTVAQWRLQGPAPYYPTLVDGWTYGTGAWQFVSARGYVQSDTSAALMVVLGNPGQVCVENATLSETPGTIAPAPNLGPIAASFLGLHVAAFAENRFVNGAFAPPFRAAGVAPDPIAGEIAEGWLDNSLWAQVGVTYAADHRAPHGGQTAQSVTVNSVTSGEVQFLQPIAVLPGQTYSFAAWVRGTPGMALAMRLQEQDPPYRTYAQTSLNTLTGAWQHFTTSGPIGDTGLAHLMFVANGPGHFSVDGATVTGPGGGPPAPGAPWPRVPFGTLRLWDSQTTWSLLEPQRGVWHWNALDSWMARVQPGQDVILTLGQSPAWASSNPSLQSYYGAGAAAPPASLKDWTDYITTVAQRYRGRIRFFEIWNEPNDQTFYAGTVAQLAALTRAAHDALKAVDPGITVITAPAYSPGYLDLYLATGAAAYADVIGYHAYATPPEATALQLADVRLVMAKHHLAAMPLWDTEAASGNQSTSAADAPTYIVRKYLTDLAFGAGRLDWYTWGHATPYCVATEAADPHTLAPAGRAYATLATWLANATVTSAAIDAAADWQIGLQRPGPIQALIVWNPAATTRFTLPAGFAPTQAIDIFGRSTPVSGRTVRVTPSPVLLQ